MKTSVAAQGIRKQMWGVEKFKLIHDCAINLKEFKM